MIEPADARHKLLSFTNLCELHLLGVIRRRHRVTLPQVRKALVFMQHQLDEPRPLASARFRTNGVDLFVEHADVLLNVSRSGRQALREDFERALTRIEFGAADRPVLLFPLTRESPANIEQPKTVLVDPLRSFGRPVLARVYVRTEVIVERFTAGDSIAEMAADFGTSPSDIEEALRFEQRRAA